MVNSLSPQAMVFVKILLQIETNPAQMRLLSSQPAVLMSWKPDYSCKFRVMIDLFPFRGIVRLVKQLTLRRICTPPPRSMFSLMLPVSAQTSPICSSAVLLIQQSPRSFMAKCNLLSGHITVNNGCIRCAFAVI